jgi:ATP-dependent RNA helicase DeaD
VTVTFAELGLSEPVAAAAAAAGYERPSALQAAALPVLRRGGNAVLHASTGAGVTAAYGLALLDRLAAAEPAATRPRALVLAPTRERAETVARALATLAGDAGIAVRATAAGWRADDADVRVTTPGQALADVQASTLKLEAVLTLVVLDAAEMYALGDGEAIATLAPLVPSEAQRVITTAAVTADVEALVEAQARRALTIPARPADPDVRMPEPAGQIGYMVVTEDEKPQMLARLLEGADEALVRARTTARAEHVLGELSRRGIADGAQLRIRAVSFDGDAGGSARVVSYDVPFSADELRRVHETGGTVLVTPAELEHFRRIAREVPFTLKQRRARTLDDSEVAAFRDTVRRAADVEDLSAQLLVLDPLFDERSPAEVAAALSALLRRKGGPAGSAEATPSAARAAGAEAGAPPKSATTGAFTRLFVSIGARDNIRPGDLVGAITGEAGIKGDQVGRVDIRDTFSVVEVAAAAADRVIRALNGTTMRGRSLRVDFDRKTGTGTGAESGRRGAGGARGSAGPRGTGGPRREGPGGPRDTGGPVAGGPRDAGGPPRRRPRE